MEDISRDGRFLLYHRINQLMALPLTAGAVPIALSDSAFAKDEGRFSPDGRSISYGSTESGAWQVYVASFPAFDNRRQVSLGGGVQARWRADGGENGRWAAVPLPRPRTTRARSHHGRGELAAAIEGVASSMGVPIASGLDRMVLPSGYAGTIHISRPS